MEWYEQTLLKKRKENKTKQNKKTQWLVESAKEDEKKTTTVGTVEKLDGVKMNISVFRSM